MWTFVFEIPLPTKRVALPTKRVAVVGRDRAISDSVLEEEQLPPSKKVICSSWLA